MARDKEKQKLAQHRHYIENKKDYQNCRDKRRKELKIWIDNYKQTCRCEKCGLIDYECLEFHHIDPATKLKTICQLVQDGVGLSKLKNEISKCKILCGNCHRKLHINELSLKEEVASSTIRRRKIKLWFKEYKLNSKLKCVKCGIDDVDLLDFHHLHSKETEVSFMVSFAYSQKRILNEVSKCEPVCVNCHRKIHKQ